MFSTLFATHCMLGHDKKIDAMKKNSFRLSATNDVTYTIKKTYNLCHIIIS